MNNNQNYFNNNPQVNNQNATPVNPNFNQPINVIPSSMQTEQQSNNTFINNQVNNNQIDNNEEINQILNRQTNKFISNDTDMQDTSLNNLNVDGEYNNMSKVDYSKDKKVIENLNQTKKNTITITSEGKVFIIIVIVLLLFIFVLPTIFDYVGTIKYQ